MEDTIFYNEIEEFIKPAQNINWFDNCGNPYSEKVEYEYIFDENIEIVKKNITRNNNYAGIVTTENLFNQANLRLRNFFKNNHRLNPNPNYFYGDLIKTTRARLNKSIDFKEISEKFYTKFQIEKPPEGWAYRYDNTCMLLYSAIIEMYYKSFVKGIPVFYEKIIPIYFSGHIITGWKGKLPSLYSQSVFPDKPIDNKKGILIIW